MHKNGWRPFWAALGAALLVLLPLVGGTVLLTRQMVRTRIQTAQPQSGVPIQLPRAEHRMTLLLCTAGEQPGFLLVYLNAAQNSLNLLTVPGELTVPFNGETASLAHCYPGASSSLNIRGMGSFNASNSPLYVIDGIPMRSGSINTMSSDAGLDIMSTINSSDY